MEDDEEPPPGIRSRRVHPTVQHATPIHIPALRHTGEGWRSYCTTCRAWSPLRKLWSDGLAEANFHHHTGGWHTTLIPRQRTEPE